MLGILSCCGGILKRRNGQGPGQALDQGDFLHLPFLASHQPGWGMSWCWWLGRTLAACQARDRVDELQTACFPSKELLNFWNIRYDENIEGQQSLLQGHRAICGGCPWNPGRCYQDCPGHSWVVSTAHHVTEAWKTEEPGTQGQLPRVSKGSNEFPHVKGVLESTSEVEKEVCVGCLLPPPMSPQLWVFPP